MLSRLKVRDFRCFAAAEAEFDPAQNIFVGANAQGKTSLLEAICVLLRLQSPRVSILGSAIRHGRPGFVTDGFFGSSHLQFYYGRERKKLALDSVEQKRARAYLELARVVYFSNQDIEIVRGPAEHRRRFLDFVAVQIDSVYRRHLRDYEKALRARNRLLKQPVTPRKQITAFDGPLVETGLYLSRARAALVTELETAATAAHAGISGRIETLRINYSSGCGDGFAAALADSLSTDIQRRQTMVGPHRDDLAFDLNRIDSSYASEGQHRSIAISLKLAQAKLLEAKFSRAPVLLIDDVFGELDLERRNALLAALPASSQRFITTTHLDWMQGRATGKLFQVENCGLESIS